MKITRMVHERHAPLMNNSRMNDCTACGAPLFQSSFYITAFADGDTYKTLYTVCSEECEKAIEEDDE